MQRSGGGHPERRGQVILVAAIGIALTLITMGMVLSAVALPGPWWTTDNVNSVEAAQTGDAVVEGYGGAIFYANFENRQGYGELRKEFEANGRYWRNVTAQLQNEEGYTMNTSVVDTTNGSTIMQAHFRNFTRKGGDSWDWDVVKQPSRVRRFAMNVTPKDTGDGEDGGGGHFSVVLTNESGATSTVTFIPAGEGEDGDANVTVRVDPSGGVVKTFEGGPKWVIVDFTEHLVAGEEVAGFPGMKPPYEVRFENPESATGRYLLVTDSQTPRQDESRYHDFCAIESPCADHAIYSANVNHSIASSALSFETEVYVAPEDPGLRFPSYQVRRRVVYYNPEHGKMIQSIKNVSGNYSIKKHVSEKPQVLGPARYDLDHAQGIDIPYLDGSQSLRMVEVSRKTVSNGKTILLRTQGQGVQNGLIGVGDFDQDTYPEVYYNEDGKIYKVNAITNDDENASLVRDVPQLKGVVGVRDIDAEGTPELIYTTNNKEVMYIRPGGGAPTTILNASRSISSGRSIGSPADFDRSDSILRIPVIRNGDIYLVSPDGTLTRVVKNPDLQKSQPIAPADIDHDGDMEIVFASQAGMKYVEFTRSKTWTEVETHLITHNGDPVNVKKDKGAR